MFLLGLFGSKILAVGLSVAEGDVIKSEAGAGNLGFTKERNTVNLTGCDLERIGNGGNVLAAKVVVECDLVVAEHLDTYGNIELAGVLVAIAYCDSLKNLTVPSLNGNNIAAIGRSDNEDALHCVGVPECSVTSIIGVDKVNLEVNAGIYINCEAENTYSAGLEVLEIVNTGSVSGKPQPSLTVLTCGRCNMLELEAAAGGIIIVSGILRNSNCTSDSGLAILIINLIKSVGVLAVCAGVSNLLIVYSAYGLMRYLLTKDLTTSGAVGCLATGSLYDSMSRRAVFLTAAVTNRLVLTGSGSTGMTESLAVVLATGCTKVTVITGRLCSLGVSECGNYVADADMSALSTCGSGVTVGGTGSGSNNGCALVMALVEYPGTVSGIAECEVIEHISAILITGITADVNAVNGICLGSKLSAEGYYVLTVGVAVVGDLIGVRIKHDTDNDVNPAGEVVVANLNVSNYVIIDEVFAGQGRESEGHSAVLHRADGEITRNSTVLPSIITAVGLTVNKLEVKVLSHIDVHLEGKNAHRTVSRGEAEVCGVISSGNPKLSLSRCISGMNELVMSVYDLRKIAT